jgi:hypothetical protein
MKLSAVCLCLVIVAPAARAGANLLPNGDMKLDRNADGMPDGWDREVQQGAEGDLARDTTVGLHGQSSLRIDHVSADDVWVRSSAYDLPAKPAAPYRFDCAVKSTCTYHILLYEWAKDADPDQYVTHDLGSGKAADWQRVSAIVKAGPSAGQFKLSLIATGAGSAWFDDVSLICATDPCQLIARWTKRPPAIDGKLDDAAWQTAARAEGFFLLGGEGKAPEADTTALLAYDDHALYVAFTCVEPHVAQIRAQVKEDGGLAYTDDCVEVFIDASGDQVGWRQFVVNTLGKKSASRRGGGRPYHVDWYTHPPTATRQPAPEWQAAAGVGDGHWTAEIAIPLDALGGMQKPGRVWGLNLCRERYAVDEKSTWSYMRGGTFLDPTQFGSLVLGGARGSKPLLVELPDRWEPPRPTIIPQPVSLEWQRGKLRIRRDTPIRVAAQVAPIAAQLLHDQIRNAVGLDLTVRELDDARARDPGGAILLAVDPESKRTGSAEAYTLHVSRDGAAVRGAGPDGCLMGVQTLRQLLDVDAEGPFMWACEVQDAPTQAWRAWHMGCPARSELNDFRRIVDLMVALKYNTIMIEVNNGVRYESHPEIAGSDALTKDELHQVVSYCKDRRLRVIPQLQTLGHFNYVLDLPQYRDLAENPDATGRWGRWTYCPSNPAVYKLVFDLMQELIDVFQPEYFHIGHDEVTFAELGTCPKCRLKKPHELFAEDVAKLHDFLAARGIRTLMWGDQLLPDHNGGPPTNTALATDAIPKDTIICDWHYGPSADFPSVTYFKKHGFDVLACGWYEPLNAMNFAGVASREKILGYSGTTWYGINGVAPSPELTTAFVLGAENSWSTDRPSIDGIAYMPTEEFQRIYSLDAPKGVPGPFGIVDLTGFADRGLVDTEAHGGWMGLGPGYDLRGLAEQAGTKWLGGVPFDIRPNMGAIILRDAGSPADALPASVLQIPIGARARRVHFLSTCSKPLRDYGSMYERLQWPRKIGEWVVTYEDGAQEQIDIVYRTVAADWNSQLGPTLGHTVWVGKTEAGARALLGDFAWPNPRPDVAIEAIDFVSSVTEIRPVLLAVTLEGPS